MHPELVRLGPLTIHSFGFMLATAFLLIAWLATKEFARRGFSPDAAGSATLGAMLGGVLGAKLYFLIDHWSYTMADPIGSVFSGAGLTYYGGLIGGAIGVLWVGRHYRIPLGVLVDIGAPLVALGYGVGRIGCFLNGCDYGGPTDLPWGLTFVHGTPPVTIPVHPTQVYESLISLGFFFFLWFNLKRWEKRVGFTMGLYLILGPAERFLVEFIRTNAPVALGLTMAQWFSLALIPVGLWLIRRSRQG